MSDQFMPDAENYQGWIPDELADSREQTFAAFDRSVGGAASFDGDAFEAIRNGTAPYDPNKLPPLVSWSTLRPYLLDVRKKYDARRDAGLWLPPWTIYEKNGIVYPLGDQGSYNSCSPMNFTLATDDNRAMRLGNRGDEIVFEKMNGWYSYILTHKRYGGSLKGGRTMAAPARLAQELGQFRESVVGTYAATAGKWTADENADSLADRLQCCYCYVGDLSAAEQTEAVFLALACDMTTNEGSSLKVTQNGNVDGYPLGKAGGSTMHAQRSRCLFVHNGVEYAVKGNTWGKVSTGGPNGFPQDSMLLTKPEFARYLGGRYHDGIIIVYCESTIGPARQDGLPG